MDDDKCPLDPWGKHHWYQTTIAETFKEMDERLGKEEGQEGVYYSHACECGQWRTGTYKK